MVKDFGELACIKDWIDIHVDHAYIGSANDEILLACQKENMKVYIMEQPSTAECLAQHFYHVFSKLIPISRIQVYETPTASATYP
jgi:6-pyruvoyl-tetrahydropterin synthase